MFFVRRRKVYHNFFLVTSKGVGKVVFFKREADILKIQWFVKKYLEMKRKLWFVIEKWIETKQELFLKELEKWLIVSPRPTPDWVLHLFM